MTRHQGFPAFLVVAAALLLGSATTAEAHTVQICWRCEDDGSVTFYARTYHYVSSPRGGLVIDGHTYAFTGVTRSAPTNLSGCTRLFYRGGYHWQIVNIKGLTPGVHQVTTTRTSAVEYPLWGSQTLPILLDCQTDEAPTANPGPDITVRCQGPEGAAVTLDGRGSSDPEGAALSYLWASEDPAVVLDDPSSPTPTGTFPLSPEGTTQTTKVMLTVRDPGGNTDSAVVTVTVTNTAPVADAGPDQAAPCIDGGALVSLDGSGSHDPDGDPISFQWTVADDPATGESLAYLSDPTSPTPAGVFPMGQTMVTLVVTDACGAIAVSDMVVTVFDDTPPTLTCTTDLAALWPPRHDMVEVGIVLIADDECAAPEELAVLCEVTSNEPDDATGDGAFSGDVDGLDGYSESVVVLLTFDPSTGSYHGSVALRAERDGAQEGRKYSIACTVVDPSGNASSTSCVVVVPNNRGKGK
jgi:hypothetical protein